RTSSTSATGGLNQDDQRSTDQLCQPTSSGEGDAEKYTTLMEKATAALSGVQNQFNFGNWRAQSGRSTINGSTMSAHFLWRGRRRKVHDTNGESDCGTQWSAGMRSGTHMGLRLKKDSRRMSKNQFNFGNWRAQSGRSTINGSTMSAHFLWRGRRR
ncbi:hypothetical protein PRIPAC_93308, partial [Pristionchus pacificus]